ncbi:MAG: phage holin family protein [Clostridia bacterium]|nr:phage holin family protein [Clostridia bacterium]
MSAIVHGILKTAGDVFLQTPCGGVCILYIMMAADFLTGLLCAMLGKSCKTKNGSFTLPVFLRGILRKILMLLVVFLASLLDGLARLQGVLQGTAIWFYIANEGLSVTENLMGMGVPIPARMRNLLSGGVKDE